MTLVALCLAIAAFRRDFPQEVAVVATIGFIAAISTGFAMIALWQAARMEFKNLFGRLSPEMDSRHFALLTLTWAMLLLTIAAAALVFSAIRS
jgi:hypothetical protein